MKKKIIIFSTTVSALIILMLVTTFLSPVKNVIKNSVSVILNPFNTGFSYVFDRAEDAFTYVFGTGQMRKENLKLNIENEELKTELARLQKLVSSEEFLKNEYEILKKTKYPLKAAYVITKDPSNHGKTFNIDKGSKDGVKTGDIILAGVKYTSANYIEGIVGKVKSVQKGWSSVEPVLSEETSISFINSRNLEYGVLNGMSNSGLSGYVLNVDSDIKKGDKLLTSGQGSVFPKDLYIGDVVDVKMNQELVKEIIVEAKVKFDKLDRVLILSKEDGVYEQD